MFKKKNKTDAKTNRPPRITKNQAQKFLAPVPEHNVFWCNDGHIFRNIQELTDAMPIMSDQTFSYHSNDSKKDFSTWIRNVVGDEKLAQSLESALDREHAARILQERCSVLVSKAG